MFKIKRPAIVGLLLILLIFTGYLNYELTQQALTKTSKEYKKYEDAKKAEFMDGESIAKGNDIDIINPSSTEDVSQVVSNTNDSIDEAIKKDNISNRNYFVEYRLSRDKLRANMVDRLNDIINNDITVEEVRTEAQQEIIRIGRHSERELQLEGLIKSKGFSEALAFFTEEDVKIVVSSGELTNQDMAKILDIVKSETNYNIDNIKISNK